MSEPLKLFIGTGVEGLRPTGYKTIDISPENLPDIVANADSLPMIESGSADEFYASHVLEHFSWPKSLLVLEEWARTLKLGGIIKIAVPDMEVYSSLIMSGVNPFVVIGEIYGGHFIGEHQGHVFGFTKRMLVEILTVIGFDTFDVWASHLPEAANGWIYADNAERLGMSLNISGIKRREPLLDISQLAAVVRQRIRDPFMTVVRDIAISMPEVPDFGVINASLYQRLNFKYLELRSSHDRLTKLLQEAGHGIEAK